MAKKFEIEKQLDKMRRDLEGLKQLYGDPYINVQRAGKGVTLKLNVQRLKGRLRGGGGGDSAVTRAACTADAGAGSTIAATLFNADGTTGDAITVTCNISNGTELNEASPRLETGDPIYVKSIFWDDGGTPTQRWECVTNFQATDDCECVQSDAVLNSLTINPDERLTFDGVAGDTYMTYVSADGELETTVDAVKVTETKGD